MRPGSSWFELKSQHWAASRDLVALFDPVERLYLPERQHRAVLV
jgi:hypothetical protein